MPEPGDAEVPCSVVAIGASGSGGLGDMAELLSLLPATFPGTILLTLHRLNDRPSSLAEILQRVCALPVVVACHMQRLQPGTCYVGEPAKHLTLRSPNSIGLVADPRHGYRNATIGLLFGSVACHAGDRAIGVVLSGCLADGSRGLAAIIRAGGIGMARDPRRSFEGDMPRNAIAFAGPLDCVDDVPGLAGAIVARVMGPVRKPVAPSKQRAVAIRRLQQVATVPDPNPIGRPPPASDPASTPPL